METHIYESYCDINGLIAENNGYLVNVEEREEVKHFLAKFYTLDEEWEEFDDTPKPNYREYEIKFKREDEYGDVDCIGTITVKVSLPTDEDAKELAAILDGKVASGLNKDCPVFRITYRNEIYIKAKDHHEAERIFAEIDHAELSRLSNFVEIVSTEKQD